MRTSGFDWESVTVTDLCVTVEGREGEMALHSADPDFALRLAEALVAAHGRRTNKAGTCAIAVMP
jgi:hypothetical protein